HLQRGRRGAAARRGAPLAARRRVGARRTRTCTGRVRRRARTVAASRARGHGRASRTSSERQVARPNVDRGARRCRCGVVRASRSGATARRQRPGPLCSDRADAAASGRCRAVTATRTLTCDDGKTVTQELPARRDRPATAKGGMTAMAILMCRPEYFGVEYEINPWMHVSVKVDHTLADTQWRTLYAAYQRLGVDIELAEPHAGLPDMVFSANAAAVWDGAAVLSNFRHPERQGEEGYWRRELERRGFTVHALPKEVAFEGAGDALFVGDRLFCGYGFRTDRDAHAAVGRLMGVDVVSIELADPRFYHLDTCFCPLNDRTVLYAPDALTSASARLVRQLVPHV